MLVVVDADPGFGLIGGTKNSANPIHRSDQVNSRKIFFWRCFAKTKGMNFLNAIELCEKFSGVARMIKPVECGYPEVAFVFRSGINPVLPPAIIPAVPFTFWRPIGQGQSLFTKITTFIVTDKKLSFKQ